MRQLKLPFFLLSSLFTLACSSLLLAQSANSQTAPQTNRGGAACVMAKWMGNSLAYSLKFSQISGEDALAQAVAELHQQGYTRYKLKNVDITHPQMVTDLPHGFYVLVKTNYASLRGRDRTSYGCGFSPRSADEALQFALSNLQSFSWGWELKRDGYEVVKHGRY